MRRNWIVWMLCLALLFTVLPLQALAAEDTKEETTQTEASGDNEDKDTEKEAEATATPTPTPTPSASPSATVSPTPTPSESPAAEEEEDRAPSKYLFIGDSRTVEMSQAVTEDKADTFIAQRGAGIDWFCSEAVKKAREVKVDTDYAVLFLMGVNDREEDASTVTKRYCDEINALAEEWTALGADVYFVSVTAVDEAKENSYTYPYNVKNSWIAEFNKLMQKQLSSNVRYLDINSVVKSHLSCRADGIHYNDSSYQEIYGLLKNDVALYNAVTDKTPYTAKNASDKTHDVTACSSKAFTDVNKNPYNWQHSAIDYVTEKGLMAGISDKLFAPNSTVTRGMAVTMLYALEGKPEVSGASRFKDIKSGQYFYKPILWADGAGVANGTGEDAFSPMVAITREQFAVMLYGYARFSGFDTGNSAALDSFKDAKNVSNYAKEALCWAVANGVMSGDTGGRLLPKSSLTRAQTAAMLRSFMENIVIPAAGESAA